MGTVAKKKSKKQSAKATLAEVVKEMAKPRVAMSAREHSHFLRNEVLVVENDVEK
jgi:TolA-binding protein